MVATRNTQKYVCAECVEDSYLKRYISENSTDKECTYCGEIGKKPIAITLDDLTEVIEAGMEREWSKAVDEMFHDSGEGGYQPQSAVYQTYDIVFESLEISDNTDLLGDLVHEIGNEDWCQRNFGGYLPDDAMKTSWETFCDIVKHKVRYLFRDFADNLAEENMELTAPSEVMDFLGGKLLEYVTVTSLPTGTTVYRVRPHDGNTRFTLAKDLAPPPEDRAIHANRMSPAGIPMFYGSFDAETAVAETRNPKDDFAGTVGAFSVVKELKLLDLTTLPEVPSLFDPKASERRPSLVFLRAFLRDITKPVIKDGREHIEYVPTQILTEYLRYGFSLNDGNSLDGIIYPSAVRKGFLSFVLFCENKHCVDKNQKVDAYVLPWVQLESVSEVCESKD